MKYNKTNYRSKKSKRSYNKTSYKITKIGTKFIRDNVSPNPFKKIEGNGFIGKACGKVGNKLISPVINELSYSAAGIYYDKTKDKPQKGSLLYTLFHFLFIFIALGIVTLIVWTIGKL